MALRSCYSATTLSFTQLPHYISEGLSHDLPSPRPFGESGAAKRDGRNPLSIVPEAAAGDDASHSMGGMGIERAAREERAILEPRRG